LATCPLSSTPRLRYLGPAKNLERRPIRVIKTVRPKIDSSWRENQYTGYNSINKKEKNNIK